MKYKIFVLLIIIILINSCYDGETFTSLQPTVIITTPTNQETVSGKITLSGTSTGRNIQLVEVKVGSWDFAPATGTNNWSYSLDTQIIDNGKVNIYVRALDYYNTYSDIISISLQILNETEINENININIENPKNNDIVNGIITISGTVTSDIDVDVVYVAIDTNNFSDAIGTNNWIYELDTSSIIEGDHIIYVKAIDINGLYSNVVQVSITVNNTTQEPVISILTPDLTPPSSLNYPIFNGSEINLSGIVESKNPILNMTAVIADHEPQAVTLNDSNWNVILSYQNSDGSLLKDKQLILITVSDIYGYSSQLIFYIIIDNEKPNVPIITNPSFSSNQATSFAVIIPGNIPSLDNYGIAYIVVKIDDDKRNYIAEYNSDIDSWVFVFKDIVSGNHEIKVIAVDLASNIGDASSATSFTVANDVVVPTVADIKAPSGLMTELCTEATLYIQVTDNSPYSINQVFIFIDDTQREDMTLMQYLDQYNSIWAYKINMNDGESHFFTFRAKDFSSNSSTKLRLPDVNNYKINSNIPCVTTTKVDLPNNTQVPMGGMINQITTDGTNLYYILRDTVNMSYIIASITTDGNVTLIGDKKQQINYIYYYEGYIYYFDMNAKVYRYNISEDNTSLVGQFSTTSLWNIKSIYIYNNYVYLTYKNYDATDGIHRMLIDPNGNGTSEHIISPPIGWTDANYSGVYVDSTGTYLGAVRTTTTEGGMYKYNTSSSTFDLLNGGPTNVCKDASITDMPTGQFLEDWNLRIIPIYKTANDFLIEGLRQSVLWGNKTYVFRKMNINHPYTIKTIAGVSESTVSTWSYPLLDGNGGEIDSINSYARLLENQWNKANSSVVMNNEIYVLESLNGAGVPNLLIRKIKIPAGY